MTTLCMSLYNTIFIERVCWPVEKEEERAIVFFIPEMMIDGVLCKALTFGFYCILSKLIFLEILVVLDPEFSSWLGRRDRFLLCFYFLFLLIKKYSVHFIVFQLIVEVSVLLLECFPIGWCSNSTSMTPRCVCPIPMPASVKLLSHMPCVSSSTKVYTIDIVK